VCIQPEGLLFDAERDLLARAKLLVRNAMLYLISICVVCFVVLYLSAVYERFPSSHYSLSIFKRVDLIFA